MAQHHLLSAKYRDLPIIAIARLSDNDAYDIIREHRWAGTKGEPVCPYCANKAWTLGDHTQAGDKRQFKCKVCRKKFTVTSGTLLHSRKMDYVTILIAIREFVAGAKGIAATTLSAQVDVAYKSSWVFSHKMREGMIRAQLGRKLEGTVEIDGSYYGGHVHQENEKANRADSRTLAARTGKKQCVFVARERSYDDYVGRSTAIVVQHEADARSFVHETVDRMANIHADDASHWDALHGVFKIDRVNHSVRFFDKGVCTNQAESFFSRLRRMETGTHHHIAGDYLWGFACDSVWREDNRRKTQQERFSALLTLLLTSERSRTMKGYWQRHLMEDPNGLLADDLEARLDRDGVEDEADGADADAPVGDGRMTDADADALFGPGWRAIAGVASVDVGKSRRKTERKAFVPRVDTGRPKPWSELERPAGLPSMEP